MTDCLRGSSAARKASACLIFRYTPDGNEQPKRCSFQLSATFAVSPIASTTMICAFARVFFTFRLEETNQTVEVNCFRSVARLFFTSSRSRSSRAADSAEVVSGGFDDATRPCTLRYVRM